MRALIDFWLQIQEVDLATLKKAEVSKFGLNTTKILAVRA